MELRRPPDSRWMVRLGAAIAGLTLLLGIVLALVLGGDLRQRRLATAKQRAELFSELEVERALTPAAVNRGPSGGQLQALRGRVSPRALPSGFTGVVVYNRNLRAVYGRARDGRQSRGLLSAFQGKTAATVGRLGRSGAGPRVFRVYVPLRFGMRGAPTGVAEVRLAYAPIAAAIGRDKLKLYLIVGLVLMFLCGALCSAILIAARRLRRLAASSQEEALRDPLTGLPNRILFRELVKKALVGARRKKGAVAVMLMDLDRFKEINDTLGHLNGDIVLQRTGTRLESVVREADTLARLGGDEFGLLLGDIHDRAGAEQVAERVLKTLEDPIVAGGLALRVEGSIGIAIAPAHGDSVDSLLRSADVAMYAAKEARSGYAFYTPEQHTHDATALALIGELRRAVEKKELKLFYQPKVNMATGRIEGVEGLARWTHPERGLVRPDQFVPLAEHSHLLRPVTLHLLEVALSEQRAWKREGFNLSVAVNLSAQNLIDPELPDDLERLMRRFEVRPGELEVELTEGMVMAKPGRATAILERLDEMGISVAIDDFGTGYSSLSYLNALPVGTLKIDRSFVMSLAEDSGSSAAIVQSTIELAHNLGLKVVAEGVETESVWGRLAALRCDYAQGYFVSRPLPPEELLSWLRTFFRGGEVQEEQIPQTNPGVLKEWIVG